MNTNHGFLSCEESMGTRAMSREEFLGIKALSSEYSEKKREKKNSVSMN